MIILLKALLKWCEAINATHIASKDTPQSIKTELRVLIFELRKAVNNVVEGLEKTKTLAQTFVDAFREGMK